MAAVEADTAPGEHLSDSCLLIGEDDKGAAA